MITHEINKYQAPVYTPVKPVVAAQQRLPVFGKYQYAKHLQDIPFKKGDYVMARSATYPFKPEDYWRVFEFQELWYLCQAYDGKPRSMYVYNCRGHGQYVAPEDCFMVRQPPITVELPK